MDLEGHWARVLPEDAFGPHIEWREYSFLQVREEGGGGGAGLHSALALLPPLRPPPLACPLSSTEPPPDCSSQQQSAHHRGVQCVGRRQLPRGSPGHSSAGAWVLLLTAPPIDWPAFRSLLSTRIPCPPFLTLLLALPGPVRSPPAVWASPRAQACRRSKQRSTPLRPASTKSSRSRLGGGLLARSLSPHPPDSCPLLSPSSPCTSQASALEALHLSWKTLPQPDLSRFENRLKHYPACMCCLREHPPGWIWCDAANPHLPWSLGWTS